MRSHPRRFGTWLVVALLAAALGAVSCAPHTGTRTTASPEIAPTAPPITAPPATTAPLPATSATTEAPATTTTTAPVPPTTTRPPLDRSDAATIARMRADLRALLAEGPRVSGTEAAAAAARYFAGIAAAATGADPLLQEVPLPTGATSANVWAPALGSNEVSLLIGAHLDSWAGSPGADDNGSGVVVVLELLRRLADDPPGSLRVQVVGFGAEETIPGYGDHYGSALAAATMAEDGALPDLMLSVDMVGIGEQLYTIDLRDHHPTLADTIADAASGIGITVERRSYGEISDHAEFALAGVPSALLYRPGNPAYHTSDDYSVSDARLLETLRVIESLVARLDADGRLHD